jgi:addiction module HigA family antidote
MSIRNNKPLERRPTHPGEMLREEYMPDYNLSVTSLAGLLGVSRQSINDLVHERRALSVNMALRLSKVFNDSPESWLNLQQKVDLWDAQHSRTEGFMDIVPLKHANFA